MTVLLCPLCSQPRFHNLESLRSSLVNAATQSISCPICNDVLMGLDKLTIHLFGHTLNQSTQTSQCPASLEVRQSKVVEGCFLGSKTETSEQYQTLCTEDTAGLHSRLKLSGIDEGQKYEETDKLFSDMENAYSSAGTPTIFHEDSQVKNDSLCTVNMEDLSFLTSWENSVKPKLNPKGFQLQTTLQSQPDSRKEDNADLSEYMSDLLNKKLPILNYSFTMDNTDESICVEKAPGTEKKFKCEMCGFVFQNSTILSMHQELVHSKIKTTEKEFVSELREQEFFPHLLNEEQTNSDANNEVDPVPVCSLTESHINQAVSNTSEVRDNVCPDGTMPRFDCHLCSKSFKMKGSLLVHFRVAHYDLQLSDSLQVLPDPSSPEERNFPCSLCNKSFKKEQHLSQHIKTHEGKQWQCDTCNKHFTTKYFLKKHQRLHTGEMPYSCLTCNKTFTFQQSYHKHLLYHSDEKPHQCTQCGRCFKELSTLHNHQRIHSGEKPFACETCGKCFRQRVSYIVHQRIHTGVLPYQCTACKKKFRYKVSQRSHKCTSQPPGVVIRQPDIVQKILESKHFLQQNFI